MVKVWTIGCVVAALFLLGVMGAAAQGDVAYPYQVSVTSYLTPVGANPLEPGARGFGSIQYMEDNTGRKLFSIRMSAWGLVAGETYTVATARTDNSLADTLCSFTAGQGNFFTAPVQMPAMGRCDVEIRDQMPGVRAHPTASQLPVIFIFKGNRMLLGPQSAQPLSIP